MKLFIFPPSDLRHPKPRHLLSLFFFWVVVDDGDALDAVGAIVAHEGDQLGPLRGPRQAGNLLEGNPVDVAAQSGQKHLPVLHRVAIHHANGRHVILRLQLDTHDPQPVPSLVLVTREGHPLRHAERSDNEEGALLGSLVLCRPNDVHAGDFVLLLQLHRVAAPRGAPVGPQRAQREAHHLPFLRGQDAALVLGRHARPTQTVPLLQLHPNKPVRVHLLVQRQLRSLDEPVLGKQHDVVVLVIEVLLGNGNDVGD
mmetsp:Transcript_9749/g.25026  ORF Transcript_9749/g.25026 Transcript_9749/m.25026 type:complete len:255 (-) Transcript_9749:310-1074(-)